MIRKVVLFSLALTPFGVLCLDQESQDPPAEKAFKDIQVMKGVLASEVIPAMEFMCASLKYECEDCHDPKDYAASTRIKEVARSMILMQREINTKHFGGRNEITCNSCHGGKEHPAATPIPTGVSLRHQRMEGGPKPEDLMGKHTAASGKVPTVLILKGTLTAPNDQTHKIETLPLEFTQVDNGMFRIASGPRVIVSDGKATFYGTFPLDGEPAALFNRIGKAWWTSKAFAGFERSTFSGKDKLGKAEVLAVRVNSPATKSTGELLFDAKSGLLVRSVNMRRGTLGTVVTSIDYANYKTIDGTKVPMKIEIRFANDMLWTMDLKAARTSKTFDSAWFKPAP